MLVRLEPVLEWAILGQAIQVTEAIKQLLMELVEQVLLELVQVMQL